MTNQEFYTRQEVAKLLKIKENTVNLYAREGKIKALPNPFQIRKETVYSKESVKQYLQSHTVPCGYTLQEVSNELGISRQKITKIINENNILVERNPNGGGRIPKVIVPKNSFDEIKKILSNLKNKTIKQVKHHFYSSKYDIALFQLVTDEVGNLYRVQKLEGEWGYCRVSDNTFIPYEVAHNMFHINNVYPIHQKTLKQFGYAEICLPNVPHSYKHIDFFLTRLGIENMYIELQENEPSTFKLYLRESTLLLSNESYIQDGLFNELFESIAGGELLIENEHLKILAKEQRISAYISLENYKELTQLAEHSKQSLGTILDNILNKHFRE